MVRAAASGDDQMHTVVVHWEHQQWDDDPLGFNRTRQLAQITQRTAHIVRMRGQPVSR
jgi:hypothetical protein